MRDLKEVIGDCNLTFENVKQNYKAEYELVYNREKDWLNNTEDKTYRLSPDVKTDIDDVISKLKNSGYIFSNNDSSKLSIFVSQINGIIRIANRINNFKEGVIIDDTKKLHLFHLFNTLKKTEKFSDLKLELNNNLNSFKVHLFSIVKHCQNPDKYPIYYKYWKNIMGEVLNKKDDYDSLCEFYKTIENPKHLSLGAYFGAIGTILADKISKNKIIKIENDKNYKYIKNKILNIHYFDLITGYKRNPNYFLIGSKYGENNDIDMFPQMMEKQVISVGFASKLDLSAFYLTDENEIIEHLKDENENQNSINALKHFLSIKIGDKIAVKASGSPKGNKGFLSIVGICEVVQNEEGKVYSYDPNGLGQTLSVKYLEAPVYREYNLGGYGSTVHHLTKEEHIELIFENTKSLSIFEKVKSQFNKVIFDSFIDNLRKIIIQTNISKNDERVVFSVRDNRLNFTVGQRYCFNLYASDIRGVYGVISKTKLFENSESYDGTPPVPYYNYFTTFNPDSSEWNSIIDSIKEELLRTTKSGYKKYNNEDFENFVFSLEPIVKNNQMNFPINTILYGPPGTGKTYNTILRAAEIIENRVINSYDEALQIFKSKLHDQIEFITFHQNYSYEDFIQGLRPETENEGQLSFEKKDGLFKIISDKALKNLNSVNNSKPTQRDFDEVFNEFLKPVFEEGKEIEVKMIKSSFFITGTTKKSIEFRKNIGESVHSLSISTLRQMYNEQINNLIIGGLQPYYNPLMIKLLELGKSENIKVNSKNYVIIIDEINRANISRVFGELITLIEPDKRSHGKIPLEVRLPSGDSFIVPSNLYIIGTMNTADKSIALLDIALRRRFDFESMYPKYEIEGQEIFDVEILQKINEQIIKTKGHDFQIGHAYFMGENSDLIQRMNKKVIPLLLEYFMNDEKEVKGILFNAGLQIEENSWPIKISGKRA